MEQDDYRQKREEKEKPKELMKKEKENEREKELKKIEKEEKQEKQKLPSTHLPEPIQAPLGCHDPCHDPRPASPHRLPSPRSPQVAIPQPILGKDLEEQ